jgi:formylglycine-generating enzyme required for sulfatase activity/outer membrane protein assembly factor BamB
VLKLDPTGATLWKTTLDTPATDTAEDVAVDPDTGNLVVAGRTSGAFPSFTNQGQFDTFLAVLDPGGHALATFQSGNERPQHPARLAVAPGGEVIVGGSDDTFIDVNFVAATQDGFVGRFDLAPGPAVTQAWLQYVVPPSMTAPLTYVTGVAVERDGSGAAYVSFGTNHGMFVSKLRADGSPVWTTNVSPLAFDAVNAVALSPSGDLFVAGGTSLTLGRHAFGAEDAFVFKLDKQTGVPLWATQAGTPLADYPTAVAFDAQGNIYISGIVVDFASNPDDADLFAMKFAPSGQLLAMWEAGTPADDEATSLAVDRCGHVLVGGHTRGMLQLSQPNAGGEDMIIVRADLQAVPADVDHAPLPASCVGQAAVCGPNGNGSCCESPAIPGGAFDRSHDVAGDAASGSTAAPATVSDFRLDRYEVTVGRFRAFVNAGMGTAARSPAAGDGAHARIPGSGWDPAWNASLPASSDALVASLACEPTLATWTGAPAGNEQRPINCVSWYEAAAFCAWDGGYLPTEAEWNYAAAGGDQQRAYPWSSPPGSVTIDGAHASYFDDVTEDCIGDGAPGCTVSDLVPVGSDSAGDGRWGQSDLAGNVLEWTLDWAGAYPVPCADCANLTPGAHREIRGGSFASDDDDLRTGRRIGIGPGERNEITGFRCARAW